MGNIRKERRVNLMEGPASLRRKTNDIIGMVVEDSVSGERKG